MVTENEQAFAELRLRRGNPLVHFHIGQSEIGIGKRLALRDLALLEFGQQRDAHIDCEIFLKRGTLNKVKPRLMPWSPDLT